MPRRQAAVRQRTASTDVTQAIFDAALEILRTEGSRHLTVRAVAAKAGVAPMGLYSRFTSMSGLVDALLIQGFERLHATVSKVSGPDALSRLVNGCLAYREFALANPHHYVLMFQPVDKVEFSDEAFARASEAFGELQARVADAMTAGALRPADATDVAQQIWNVLHGAVSLELMGIGFTDDPGATFARSVDHMVAGLRP